MSATTEKTIDVARLELATTSTPVQRAYALGYANGNGLVLNTHMGGAWYMERGQADQLAARFPKLFSHVDTVATVPDTGNAKFDTDPEFAPHPFYSMAADLRAALCGSLYHVAYYKTTADDGNQAFVFSNGQILAGRDAIIYLHLLNDTGVLVEKCYSRDEFFDTIRRHHITHPDDLDTTAPRE